MQAPRDLCSLPDDCLEMIFPYLDVRTLGRLSVTCKKMHRLIHFDSTVWITKSRLALGSNMNSPLMIQRSKPFLSPKERCKLDLKWREGSHRITVILRYPRNMPYMILEKEQLFISFGRDIMKFYRGDNGNALWRTCSQRSPHFDDISQFALTKKELITAGRDGMICRFRKSNLTRICYMRVQFEEILTIDAKNNIIITGGKNNAIKIWQSGRNYFDPIGYIPTKIRVLCLAFLPSTRRFIGGFPGTRNIHPLQLYDLERQSQITCIGEHYRQGAGIMDIFPESDSLFLTAGYDSNIKLWDLRTPQSYVSCWSEPFDNIMYCVKSDYSHTILAGANRSGMFHVFDRRTPVCQYTFHTPRSHSPVYSIAFDASHVFTAVDRVMVQYCYL